MSTILLSTNPDLLEKANPEVTIEAEYGSRIVAGSKYTAAHHQKDRAYQSGASPAPCNNQDIPYLPDAVIVSFAMPKEGQSARDIVQSVWTDNDEHENFLAGSRQGIAGNPRGARASFEEWRQAVRATASALKI